MIHDIFISYSSKDKIVADAIVAALENKGIRCWYAPRDIKAGSDWGESITDAISDSALMLLIFSGNSNRSQRVLDEIYYAISEGKTIIPFRIEKLDPSGAMRLHLSSRHWLDAYDPSWEAYINKLIETAASNLEMEITPSVDTAPIPVPSKVPGLKSLPWKLISTILAIGVVIVSVIGFTKLRGGGVADETPTLAVADHSSTATQESEVTEEAASAEEPTFVADVEATEIPIEVVLNGYFTTTDITLDLQKWGGEATFIETLLVNLTNYDMAKSEIIPEAAESWTVSPNASLYTFKIRSDIPWVVHTPEGDTVQVVEDGEPRFLNANDFVYAFKRLCRIGVEGIGEMIGPIIKGCEAVIYYEDHDNIPEEMLDNIGVRAISDYELLIELESPSAYFLTMTSMYALAALPSWAIEDYGDAWTNPGIMPTNGYYVIDQWNTGDSVWLKRNPLLPEDMSGSGNIDTIEFVFLRDVDEAYELWLNNELDYSQVPIDKILSHRVNYQRETSQIFKSLVLFFGFNMQREPFDNVHVRRAFAAAFDNVSFVNDTLQGQGIPMIHFAPPGTFGAPPIDEIGVGYDLEFSRAQLTEAGHPNCHGFPQVNLVIWRERYFPEDAIRRWEENLNCPEGTIILTTSETGEGLGELMDTTDIIYMGWGSDYPDEHNWVGNFLPCDQSLTFFNRTCNEIDDLMQQARVETNLNARIDLYRQIEEAFFGADGVFPIAPVLMAANYYGDHTWLDRTQALLGAEEFYNWTLDMEAKLDVMGE